MLFRAEVSWRDLDLGQAARGACGLPMRCASAYGPESFTRSRAGGQDDHPATEDGARLGLIYAAEPFTRCHDSFTEIRSPEDRI